MRLIRFIRRTSRKSIIRLTRFKMPTSLTRITRSMKLIRLLKK